MPYTTNNNHNHDIDHSPSPSHVQNHHDGISPGPGRHGINHTFAISLHFQFFIFFVLTYFKDNKKYFNEDRTLLKKIKPYSLIHYHYKSTDSSEVMVKF